ncbi:chromo domain-containing protein cec-3-like isoform X2 [Halichondria panicea]|uniref:chromo domain-containing protein cec-3-like isoform X2 n=1 Tax=Halichondria panicea TaxID=6063 RepID=UPI00312B3949
MSKKNSSIYQVDTIVGHQNTEGQDYYKVHWLGYSEKEDTWEPSENLSSCLDLIKQFMNKKVPKERRKSLRDHYTFSSDDEVDTTKTKKKSVIKKTPVKRTIRASVTPSKKTTKDDSIRKSYYLRRSGTNEFSSEDESELGLQTSRNIHKTRMSLSESRFKKQLANIRKDIYTSSPRKTSTPQASPSKSPEATDSPSKVRATKKLLFDTKQSMRANAAGIPPMMTRRRQRNVEEDITVSEEPPTISQAEDSESEEIQLVKKLPKKVTISKRAVKERPQKITEEEQYFPVTWREFVLAGFVTGVAGLGYLCYNSDYCSFC